MAVVTSPQTVHAAAPAAEALAANQPIAESLEQVADLLEAQGANPFRVTAYRNAASVMRSIARPVAGILEQEGAAGLLQLPGIGQSLARAIEQLACTGRLPMLDRLRGDAQPERVLCSVPGIGAELADRIHESLGVETLADLEAAAWDGRLAQVPGMGPRRVLAVRESLAGRLRRGGAGRGPATTPGPESASAPPIAELLDVDQEYRRKADAGRLPLIAPRRFNPTGAAWLPILHARRDDRHYTALYSNTARAHELGTTHDWVVIYRDDAGGDGRWTVITSNLGRLRGRRIVRGREEECRRHYERAAHAGPVPPSGGPSASRPSRRTGAPARVSPRSPPRTSGGTPEAGPP